MSHYELGISCEPHICDHGLNPALQPCHLCTLHKQIMALTDMYKDLSIRVMANHDFKLRQIDENRKLSKRVDEIDSKLRAWDEDLEYLDSMKLPKRIEKLEEKISEKYAHPDVIGRIERLEQSREANGRTHRDYHSRIEKIELKNIEHQIERISELEKKIAQTVSVQVVHSSNQVHETWKVGCEVLISNIQKEIIELKTEIDTIRALGARAYHPKKPHKCPVCSGQSIQDIKIVKTDSGLDKLVLECHACAGKGIVWG